VGHQIISIEIKSTTVNNNVMMVSTFLIFNFLKQMERTHVLQEETKISTLTSNNDALYLTHLLA